MIASHTRQGLVIALAVAAALAAALALMFAGFGGGQATAANTSPVKIKNFKFKPKTLNISKGTKVKFTNKDSATHTATDKGKFNTGKIKHNKSVTVTFKQKGTYKYICTIHPFMTGKIVVG